MVNLMRTTATLSTSYQAVVGFGFLAGFGFFSLSVSVMLLRLEHGKKPAISDSLNEAQALSLKFVGREQ